MSTATGLSVLSFQLTLFGLICSQHVHFEDNPTFTYFDHPSSPRPTTSSFDQHHSQLLELCNLVAQQPHYQASQPVVGPFDLAQPAPAATEAPFATNQLDYSLLASLYPTSPGPPTISNELHLDTSDLTFWSAFLSPPVPAERPLQSTSQPLPLPLRRSQPSRLLPSATGIATRHGSPTLEEAEAASRGERSWPMHWTPTEADSALEVDQPVETVELDKLLPAEFVALPAFDEASKMCVLETIRSAQMSDYEYHTLVSLHAYAIVLE